MKQFGIGERTVKCVSNLSIDVRCGYCGKELYCETGEHLFSNNDVWIEYCRECALSTLYQIGTKEERLKLFEELKVEFENE
jgi:hypothetical protein